MSSHLNLDRSILQTAKITNEFLRKETKMAAFPNMVKKEGLF